MTSDRMPDAKFKLYIERKVRNTIRKYKLFSKTDKVGVAVSGGKDSTTLLYVLNKLGYDVEAITIDAAIGNYTKQNLENLKKVCKKHDVKLDVISFREEFGMSLCYIRDMLKSKGHEYSSCKICGILKRYLLNKHSRRLKFDCLATGHNLDDQAQSIVMNLFRNDFTLMMRQGPVSGVVSSKKFVKRVKPLYLISEEEIVRYSKLMKFPVNYGICPCSTGAYRRDYINMLDGFEKKNPHVKYNIIKFHEQMAANMIKKKGIEVGQCKKCGEPASRDVCKVCEILKSLSK
ncbi:MAG: TIGR00269 family protein [Nanoarchaeota archaeon]|nr:TIGR00269 family protein [Nanoarchaeota archaeon]